MASFSQGVPSTDLVMVQTDYSAKGEVIYRQVFTADTVAELRESADLAGQPQTPADIVHTDLSMFFASNEGRSGTVWITPTMGVIFHRYNDMDSGRTVFRIMKD